MSTYATTVWIDLPPDGEVAGVARALEDFRDPVTPESDATAVWIEVETEWVRITTYLGLRVEMVDEIAALLASAGRGRAAIAEDNDEFGACWVVLAAEGGAVRTVHRRYVLNADPRSRRQVRHALRSLAVDGEVRDPRLDDVAGTTAASAAAHLFGVDPGPVIAAEAAAERAFERMGVVGGPFPWIEPMGLAWPGPEAGRRFRRSPDE